MNSRHIVDRFELARARGEELVLVSVYETIGSTYSKAGTRMLIAASGESQGLVSGGCLEGDLAERARQVLKEKKAMTLSYDLRDDADELFGLGIGCNGLIRVILQPLTPQSAYEPMSSIAEALLGDSTAVVATVIDSDDEHAPVGATLVLLGGARSFGFDGSPNETPIARTAASTREPQLVTEQGGVTVLYTPVFPVPKLLILGAGLDAIPLVNVAAELGWRVTLADHRPGYLGRSAFGRAEERKLADPKTLASDFDLNAYDAIVVMSHHLKTDGEYLRQLADTTVPYLGVLGPPARKERLIADLGDASSTLGRRLRGPVGIDINADSAETIALSVAAEIQSVLSSSAASRSHRTS